MQNILAILFLAATSMTSAANGIDNKVKEMAPIAQETAKAEMEIRSTITIDPKMRAMDLIQAFEVLRREKTAGKVAFKIAGNRTITNIIDLTMMNNGTMILFRYNSPLGIQFQLVNIEDIISLNPL